MKILEWLFEGGGDSGKGLAIAAVVAYCVYKVMAYMDRRTVTNSEYYDASTTTTTDNYNNYKLALVVRTDLKMSKGKVAVQCAHAAVEAYKAVQRHPQILQGWNNCGQAKITLKVNSVDALLEIAKHAKAMGLLSYVVQDAGRTQIASGSKTVCAVGPALALQIDRVTGHLKLY